MLSRRHIRRLEQAARGELDFFSLQDGTRYYFEPLKVWTELYLYALACQLGEPPEEIPDFYRMLIRARDPEQVLLTLEPESAGAFVNPAAVFEREALISERKLIPVITDKPEDMSQ